MSVNARLVKILSRLAIERAQELGLQGRNAAHLIAVSNPQSEAEVKKLARTLAEENILVLVAFVPPALAAAAVVNIQTWINAYAGFYSLFANALFPGLNKQGLAAHYADGQQPPVIVVRGGATPVIEVIAGFVVPFIVRGQMKVNPPEFEYRALVEVICEELDCNGLSMVEYQNLRRTALGLLQELVRLPMRQVALTQFDRELFADAPPPLDPPRQLPGNTPPNGLPPFPPQTASYGGNHEGGQRNGYGMPSGGNSTTPRDDIPNGATRPLPKVPSAPIARSPEEQQRYPMDYIENDAAVAPETREMFQDSVGLERPASRDTDDNRGRRNGGKRTTRSLPVYDLPDDPE